MGMRIGSNTNSTAAVTSTASQWQQRKQAGKDLESALKSGDLSAAQTAYATLTKDGTGKLAGDPNSLMAKLGAALQSGDMASAQKIAAGMALHHHHRTGGGNGAGGGTAQTPAASPAGTGTLLNVSA